MAEAESPFQRARRELAEWNERMYAGGEWDGVTEPKFDPFEILGYAVDGLENYIDAIKPETRERDPVGADLAVSWLAPVPVWIREAIDVYTRQWLPPGRQAQIPRTHERAP